MRLYRSLSVVVLVVMVPGAALPTSKEEIVLKTEAQGLQDQLARLAHNLDSNIALLNSLVNKNTQQIHGLDGRLQELRNRLQPLKSFDEALMRNLTSEVNSLDAGTNDLQKRILTLKLSPASPARATLPSTPIGAPELAAQTKPAESGSISAKPAASSGETSPVIDAGLQALYESAMEHYRLKEFEASSNEFTKYLKSDQQSETAIDAQFHLAEIEFEEKDFEGALEDYTATVTRLTDAIRAPIARYKKALCLLELERRDEAILELHSVIEKFPASAEAGRASRKLKSLEASNGKPPTP